jgi:hypothetical protein
MDLRPLTIRPANDRQKARIIKYVVEEWGPSEAGLEYFVTRHPLNETKDYATNGKIVHW